MTGETLRTIKHLHQPFTGKELRLIVDRTQNRGAADLLSLRFLIDGLSENEND